MGPQATIYTIVKFGDPVLETPAQPVREFGTNELRELVESMFESMYAAKGLGLAAPQIGVSQRLAVIDTSAGQDPTARLVLINPEILAREGEASSEEGCLSVPGIFDEVKRAAKVRVRAQDRNGGTFERDFEDILAVCVQHEMDHLDGRLFVDYLSDLKRERIRKKLEKDRKERASRPATAPKSRSRRSTGSAEPA